MSDISKVCSRAICLAFKAWIKIMAFPGATVAVCLRLIGKWTLVFAAIALDIGTYTGIIVPGQCSAIIGRVGVFRRIR